MLGHKKSRLLEDAVQMSGAIGTGVSILAALLRPTQN
jgi:hypothetical protein